MYQGRSFSGITTGITTLQNQSVVDNHGVSNGPVFPDGWGYLTWPAWPSSKDDPVEFTKLFVFQCCFSELVESRAAELDQADSSVEWYAGHRIWSLRW